MIITINFSMLYIYPFLSVILVSLVSLVGVFFIYLKDAVMKKYVLMFVSLAVGALLGDAFIHLIPVLVSVLIISGMLLFFMVEKFLHWHHHDVDEHNHIKPVGKMILISDGIHNLVDGIIIGISYMAGVEVGIATTIAVILHEIPQEIGDFGVLLHAGYTKAKALLFNFYSALLSIAGVALSFFVGEYVHIITDWFVPIAAGGFIYIAVADLIPEIHRSVKKSQSFAFVQVFMILLGVFLMYALLGLE
jgi:zinc and cadmium transporter